MNAFCLPSSFVERADHVKPLFGGAMNMMNPPPRAPETFPAIAPASIAD
jgi:hypothetical protein